MGKKTSSSGHTIQDEGSALADRPGLNFIGAGVSAVDNAGADRTDVTISSGAGTVTHTPGALTINRLVIGNDAEDVNILGSLGTTTTLLHGNAAGAPTFGAVSLTADVSGITPTANGGTGIGDGANGQKFVQGYKTELTTINAAPTTQTTITIPANAILKAVLMRVTTVIPTAATMVVTTTTTGTILQQGASIAVAAGTTDIGTRAWGTNYAGVADQTITITPNLTPANNTGRVRFDIYYEIPTVATS